MKVVDHVFALLQSDNAVFYPRWPFLSAMSDGERIRRFAIQKRFHHRHSFARFLLNVLLFVIWPVRVLILGYRYTRQWGDEVRQRSGRGKFLQFLDQCWLGIGHCIPPVDYYRYETYRPENRAQAHLFLHTSEAQSLFRWLNRNVDSRRAGPIQDKRIFADWCGQHGLPTVPLVGTIAAGQVTLSAGYSPNRDPQTSLFIKPSRGSRGEGSSIWNRLTDGKFSDGIEVVSDWQSLLTQLQSSESDGGQVIQPMLTNDSQIADLSGGGLSAIRIVTGKSPDGQVQCVSAAYKMSWRQQSTNTHGLFSGVDLDTGRLGRAFSYRPICAGYDAHPDTEAQIAGRVIPYWHSAKELAVRAHQELEGYAFIGWDIAVACNGVVLLEGNSGWDVVSMQKSGQPLLLNDVIVSTCPGWLNQA